MSSLADGRSRERGGVDCLVLLTVLILLVAGGLIAWLTRPEGIDGTAGAGLRWLALWAATFGIGTAVGSAELLSRYRDNPRDAVLSGPGMLYILCNGLAAMIALFLLRNFEVSGFKDATDDPVAQALIAGTGAMVLLRSKLFTVRQANGNDVAFGPAFAVDTFLSTINREVDRRRVPMRNGRVAAWARRLGDFDFATAVPYLNAALAAFQDMDEDDAARLRDEYNDLLNDPKFAPWENEVKFYLVGFDILTVFGEPAFESLFESLERHLLAIAARANAS